MISSSQFLRCSLRALATYSVTLTTVSLSVSLTPTQRAMLSLLQTSPSANQVLHNLIDLIIEFVTVVGLCIDLVHKLSGC